MEWCGCGEFGFDVGGVDGVGSFAGEAEEDGAVGAVAYAGEGEGAVEIDADAGGARGGSEDSSSRTKRRAARMGPTVWELEGPMPILKSSKRLVFTCYCRREDDGQACGGWVWP